MVSAAGLWCGEPRPEAEAKHGGFVAGRSCCGGIRCCWVVGFGASRVPMDRDDRVVVWCFLGIFLKIVIYFLDLAGLRSIICVLEVFVKP